MDSVKGCEDQNLLYKQQQAQINNFFFVFGNKLLIELLREIHLKLFYVETFFNLCIQQKQFAGQISISFHMKV